MDGRDQPTKLKPLHLHKKKLSVQHAVKAPGLAEKELRMLNCVAPDVPGFERADLKPASFMLHKKKIKKRDSSRNQKGSSKPGRAGSRVRQKTVDLPAQDVNQFLQQYIPDL